MQSDWSYLRDLTLLRLCRIKRLPNWLSPSKHCKSWRGGHLKKQCIFVRGKTMPQYTTPLYMRIISAGHVEHEWWHFYLPEILHFDQVPSLPSVGDCDPFPLWVFFSMCLRNWWIPFDWICFHVGDFTMSIRQTAPPTRILRTSPRRSSRMWAPWETTVTGVALTCMNPTNATPMQK